jgi:hypothetical protein
VVGGACGGGPQRVTTGAAREKQKDKVDGGTRQETWRLVGGVGGVRWPRPVRLMQAIDTSILHHYFVS